MARRRETRRSARRTSRHGNKNIRLCREPGASRRICICYAAEDELQQRPSHATWWEVTIGVAIGLTVSILAGAALVSATP